MKEGVKGGKNWRVSIRMYLFPSQIVNIPQPEPPAITNDPEVIREREEERKRHNEMMKEKRHAHKDEEEA